MRRTKGTKKTKPAGEVAPAESVTLPTDSDFELIREFVTESREFIDNAERALLQLETNPDDHEAVNTVFRAFHTVKGTAGYLNLIWIGQVAHRAESLLSRMRDREIRCAGVYADLALRSVDMVKALLQSIQDALGGEPMYKPANYDVLYEALAKPDPRAVESVKQAPTQPVSIQRKGSGDGVESTIRVSTPRLDRLIEMVGELVIAQSMVSQDKLVVGGMQHELARKVAHAGKIVRELQDLSMSMRMVPLKATFHKMDRLVRDLAHKSGKFITLRTEDRDTEIDRNMVDVINDLLVHMVRNAADHGIEDPDVRVKNGKDATGTISLSASHSGGSVLVEICDDGKGLDRERIIQKAIAKGLIDSAKGMSDEEVFGLIFEPGFSTVDQITDVSGRGVGMDVVKRGVESLRGRIQIISTSGRGTSFSVLLPLTLAITDGMLVRVGEERYIIPTINIHISFRPKPDELAMIAGRGEMVMQRGELMPIFRLHRIYEVAGAIENATEGLLVVVSDKDKKCALLVDELLGQQQVVAKSLPHLGSIPGVSGGAILGDGCVGLIIDPTQLLAFARSAAGTTAA